MNDPREPANDDQLQIEIDPEPTPEELVAILEVVRSLQNAGESDERVEPGHGSNWAEIARREELRPAEWPPQQVEWTMIRR